VKHALARRLRRGQTAAERKLWYALRDRRFHAYKFRRQQPVGIYVVDFVCFEQRLIIELDGSQHAEPERVAYDAARTRFLEREGFHVLRFWNSELNANAAGVLEAIRLALEQPPHRSVPGAGYGLEICAAMGEGYAGEIRSSGSIVAQADKHSVLKSVFGFDAFRPGQEAVIDILLAGRNVLAVMPTGSGKSLCFQIPALLNGGLTIVVSPLVALMQDQVAALRLGGVAAGMINSSQSRETNVAAWQRVVSGETRLLYMAPERLMTERMLAALARRDVKLIAIDEAHCISQWGPAFRPEYRDLARLRDLFPDIPVAALTATADAVTRADIAERLFAGNAETLVLGFDRPNICLTVKDKQDSKRQLLAFLASRAGQSGIVYCLSRKRTEQTAEYLVSRGIRALPYHAGMSKESREANQNRFMTERNLVMTATIAFGMGIDKSDVRFVFHMDLPSSLEAYYQEIGRAGRDGAEAHAHLLLGTGDIRMRRMFIDEEQAGEDRRRREHQRLNALVGYCEATGCRRQILLSWFGETAQPCGNCDNCLEPAQLVDRTAPAQLVLSAIKQTGERYGAGHIVDALLGHSTERIVAARHNALSSFGTGAQRKKIEWQALIRQLITGGWLTADIAGYGGLSIPEKGRTLLEGASRFLYREPATTPRATRRNSAASPAVVDDSLLASLKSLRLRIAKQRALPAYLVFSDRTLIDMAQRRPRSREEMSEVNGVGASKLNEFGDMFLSAIADHPAIQRV
jgi:ATP-dependent DNA helicase RecQ